MFTVLPASIVISSDGICVVPIVVAIVIVMY
jgi:hypothetical protein